MEKRTSPKKNVKTVPPRKIFVEVSAGGVVFKKFQIPNSKSQIKWLITKSSPSELYPEAVWRLPKGWVDDRNDGKNPGPLARGEKRASEEELQITAKREVREEAGVEARIAGKVGTEKFFFTSKNGRTLKFVTFYLMEWQEDLANGYGFETSEVGWFAYKEARKKLKHSGEKKLLDKAKELLERGTQENLI